MISKALLGGLGILTAVLTTTALALSAAHPSGARPGPPSATPTASAKPAASATPAATSSAETKSAQKGKKQVMEKATFGAGCFWGVEAAFRQIPGVTATAVGYTGGTLKNPTYEQVCTDRTGHAEVVAVTYDPAKVSYDDLLRVFWTNHDPTQKDRQGPDVGRQYRSAIFYHSPEQKAAAEASKKALEAEKRFSRPIATEITPAEPFYRAEEYHQQYLEKRGLSTCHIP